MKLFIVLLLLPYSAFCQHISLSQCFTYTIPQKEKYICNSSHVIRDGKVVQFHQNTSVLIDTLKHSVSIPLYGIYFLYDKNHINELQGFKMYVNKDYGEFIVTDNLSYASFIFYNGADMAYEFLGLKQQNTFP